MTKSAFLRVYSPEVPASTDPVPGFVKTYGMLSESDSESEWVVDWEGKRLVCPQNLRLRVLESTVAFAKAFGGMGVGLIPEEAAKAADRELKTYHSVNPAHRSHVLTSAWHVPVRWFVLFDPSDKLIYEGPKGPRLRYRTNIDNARRRATTALDVLQSLGMFQGPAEELAQLVEWLAPFAEGSMVELDYADVSELFDSQELVFDDSCELIQESVRALGAGDMLLAGENYGKVVSRWAPAFSVTFSS